VPATVAKPLVREHPGEATTGHAHGNDGAVSLTRVAHPAFRGDGLTAEQWIKEGKNAIQWTRLSCRRFKDNQTRLQLFALAYNLGNFLRQMALPREVKHLSLTTLRDRLIKIGAKVVSHSKTTTFHMAEVAVPQKLFAAILDRIARLRASPQSV
jgi:hypothetical protein